MLSISPDARDIQGPILTPEDPGYDAARTVFLGDVDRRPALIARPTDAADVARVIALARDSGAELAVRGGGHSPAGHSASDGGVVLDVRGLRELDIDLASRTAWAGGGLTAGEYTTAAGEHGLATGFGDAGSVGIGGITLSGGVGFLVREHGMTIDQLLAAEIVTADGRVLEVDAERHPDLFWAIRGGGGNFGVVTRLRFQLHDVSAVHRRHPRPAGLGRRARPLPRRSRGGARRALHHRQRDGRAADAVPARRGARPADRAGDARLDRRRRRRRAGARAVPRAGRAAGRHGAADALHGHVPARRSRLSPGRGRPHRARVGRRRGDRGRLDLGPRPAGSCSCACSAARWRACRRTRPPSPTGTRG